MLASTHFTFLAALSSIAIVNGAVIPRYGNSTELADQVISPLKAIDIGRSSTTLAQTTSTTTTLNMTPTSNPLGVAVAVGISPRLRTEVDCSTAPNWQPHSTYAAGDQATYFSQLYTAKESSHDNAPSTRPDQWTNNGFCAESKATQLND